MQSKRNFIYVTYRNGSSDAIQTKLYLCHISERLFRCNPNETLSMSHIGTALQMQSKQITYSNNPSRVWCMIRRVRKIAWSCLSVRMQQLGSHCTDFHEIWCLGIFRKSVEKIHVTLAYEKNKEYFTWRPMYNFWQCLDEFFLKGAEKIKTYTFYVQYLFFFPKIVSFMR